MSKLLDRTRALMRMRHYSYQTEKVYIYWMKQYFYYHNLRHPKELSAPEVEAFLTHLAVEKVVTASTQNQALFALLFLYREVLKINLLWLEAFTPAKKPAARAGSFHKRRSQKEITTTMLFTHVLNQHRLGVKSPADG